MHLVQYKIYLFYIQPCLLSYKYKESFYLAVWVEEPSLYLVSKVLFKDLIKIENNKELRVRHLFVQSSYSFLYDVDKQKVVKTLSKIPEDYLPLI